MPEPADHRAAERILQRKLTGASVSDAELRDALAHVADCAACTRRFDVGHVTSYLQRDDDVRDMDEAPVEPGELIERVLTAALGKPEPVVRLRAAERLGRAGQLGPEALAELTRVAA